MAIPWNETSTAELSPSVEVLSAMDKLFMLSDEQRELADKIQTPMHYVFAAIAIPLAVCNIIVFSQREMRSPSAVYVISLNAGQLFYVVSTTLDDIWAAFVAQPYSQYAHSVYRYYIAVYGGVFVAKRGSYAILVPSSVERLYAVLRPLHLKNFLLSKHPGLVVLCIYALSAILHVYFLTKSVVSVVSVVGELKDKEGNTIYRAVRTKLYARDKAVNDFFSLAAKFILIYTSLALQLVLNALTVWALRRHNTASKHVQSSASDVAKRQQERQLTITLLLASASYVIFSLPAALFNVFNTIFPEFLPGGKYKNLYYVMSGFCYNMTVLGCGIDFFCYLALSSKYRKTISRIFCCGKLVASGSRSKETLTETADISEATSGHI